MPSKVNLSTELLLGPRLKVARSAIHIDELRRLTQPLHSQFYEISQVPYPYQSELEPGGYELTFVPLRPVSKILALCIGDALHNLRSALDHIATGIIRSAEVGRKPYFPMNQDWNKLAKNRDMAPLEAALPGSKDLILSGLRPRNGQYEQHWRALQALDNDDKHSLLIPNVVITEISNINATALNRGNTYKNLSASNDANSPFVLLATSTRLVLHGKAQASAEVTFGEGTPLAGQDVHSSLLEISEIVSGVITGFERLLQKQ